MRIRKFRNEDTTSVSYLGRINVLTINNKDYPEDTVQALLEEETPQNIQHRVNELNYHYFVAVQNKRVVGVAAYEENNLHSFFVHPKFHRQGIGSALLNRVLGEAKEAGISKIKCNSSLTAEGFYRKHGFKRIKRVTFPFRQATLAVIQMTKKL